MKPILLSLALFICFGCSEPKKEGPIKEGEKKVKVTVRFNFPGAYANSIQSSVSKINNKKIIDILTEFGISTTTAVFKNRYASTGQIKMLTALDNSKHLEFWRCFYANAINTNQLITKLNSIEGVEVALIESPIKLRPQILPNDPAVSNGVQWHLRSTLNPSADIDAESAWNINTGRNDVVIAVLDGGVNYNLLELDPGNRTRVIAGVDTGSDDNDPLDDLPYNDPESFAGHGTKVASAIGAIANNGLQGSGVMWNCKIMPVKMVGDGGIKIPFILDWNFSATAFPSDVADAIDYAVNNGANVLNLSYGFPSMGWPIDDIILQFPTLAGALAHGYENNVVAVAAMGNEFNSGNPIMYPAGFREWVIAVGATTHEGVRAGFSSTGNHISLAAPGQAVIVTDRQGMLNLADGTSIASPIVAGVAGLIISQAKDKGWAFTNDDVRHLLELTATDLGAPGFDQEFGYGLVNAFSPLSRMSDPNGFQQFSSSGGSQTTLQTYSQWVLLSNRWGLAQGMYYQVDEVKISKHVNFPVPFCNTPTVWTRERQSISLGFGNPNSGRPSAKVMNITSTGFDVEYAAYYVRYNSLGQQINKWIPSSPAATTVAYSALGVKNLAAAAGPISGPELVCSAANFSLPNMPQGGTLTWASSNSNGLSITASGLATRIGNFNGPITITATLTGTGTCGTAFVHSKSIYVGVPPQPGQLLQPISPMCVNSSKLATIASVQSATSFTWWSNDPNLDVGNGEYWTSNLVEAFATGTRQFTIKSNNACGSSVARTYNVGVTSCGGGMNLVTVSPNPTTGTIEILIKESNGNDEITSSKLVDQNGVSRLSSNSKGQSITIHADGLTSGLYLLYVQIGNKEEVHRILIKNSD